MTTTTTTTTRSKRTEPPVGDEERRRLQVAMAFLAGNWRGVINETLDRASRAAGMSRFHFHRRFRVCFGRTPKAVVTERQIEEAKRLMRAGVALADVADRCGFAHQSHLTQRFKQIVGTTPAAWARREDQNESP